ncbi:MAG: carboxypeptidase-like regulatory domain-containing protein [Bacteroidota bacterium]
MRLTLVFIMLLCLESASLWAQNQVLNGRLIDADSKQAVPYASIRIENQAYGCISNAEGEFNLAFPDGGVITKEGILKISCIGYETQRIALKELNEAKLLIVLKPKAYSLETVTIYSSELDAREMVRQALQFVPLNYAQKPYQLQSFYRHYCRESGVYGRLIEAVVEINDMKGHDRTYRFPEQKLEMRLTQLRRSFDFTRFSAFQHIPIALNRSLLADIVSYQSLLSRHLHSRKLSFEYQDTTYYDGKVVYLIGLRGRAEGLQMEAQLYIQAADLAIIKVDHRYSSQRRKDSWLYQREDHFVADYQLYQGKYYLNYILNEGEFREQQFDSLDQVVYSQDHYHHVEMMTQTVRLEGFDRFKGKEPNEAEMTQVPYKASFWQQYSVLTATPLETRIEADLNRRMPLSQQFASEQLAASTQDQLAQQYFDRWLAKQNGRVAIVGVWNSQYTPSVKELWQARKLMKEFQDTPFSLLLISTDRVESQWQEAIRKKRLYGVDHLRVGSGLESSVCQALGAESEPYFVLYSPSGERLVGGASLPSTEQIRRLLSTAQGR